MPEAYPDINSWANISAAARVTVSSGQTVSGVDFSLPAGFTISGRLVDDQAQPVPGAGANIHDPDQDIEFGCALGFGSSDTDGTFQVNVPAGTYDLAFCKGDTCATVSRELEITDHTNLGDVLFAEVPEPPRVFDPEVLESGYQAETVVPGGPNTPSDVAVTSDGTVYLAAIRSWNIYQTGRRDGDCEPGADALVCLRVPAARAQARLRRARFLPLAARRDILDQAQDDDIPGVAVGTDAGQLQSHRR